MILGVDNSFCFLVIFSVSIVDFWSVKCFLSMQFSAFVRTSIRMISSPINHKFDDRWPKECFNFPSPMDEENLASLITKRENYRSKCEKSCKYWLIYFIPDTTYKHLFFKERCCEKFQAVAVTSLSFLLFLDVKN